MGIMHTDLTLVNFSGMLLAFECSGEFSPHLGNTVLTCNTVTTTVVIRANCRVLHLAIAGIHATNAQGKRPCSRTKGAG
jgi:hypothetical protein